MINRRSMALAVPLIMAASVGAGDHVAIGAAVEPSLPGDRWREPKRNHKHRNGTRYGRRKDDPRHKLKRRKLAKAGKRAARKKAKR